MDEWAFVFMMVALVAAIAGVAVGALRFAVAALIVAVMQLATIVASLKMAQIEPSAPDQPLPDDD